MSGRQRGTYGGRGGRGGRYYADYGSSGRGGGDGRGGGRGGGRGRQSSRGGAGGRGGGRGDIDPRSVNSVLTNLVPASISQKFSFYLYSVDCKDRQDKNIESRGVRSELFNRGLWNGVVKEISSAEKEDLRRVVFFAGSYFFSARPIPGLESDKLPLEMVRGDETEGNVMTCISVTHFGAPQELTSNAPLPRDDNKSVSFDPYSCGGCSKSFPSAESMLQHCESTKHSPKFQGGDGPAPLEVFVAYINLALQRALGERLAKWGRDFIDPSSAVSRKELGVSVYRAFSCVFNVTNVDNKGYGLTLMVDLRAKVIRNRSLLDDIYESRTGHGPYSSQEQKHFRKKWVGERVIYKNDKKTYTVTGLDFDHSPASLPVPGKQISHEAYFQKKNVKLPYPRETPMVEALGRSDKKIYLPAELVTGNELDDRVRQQLPKIASFDPQTRDAAIETVKHFLIPGAQHGRALLPNIGILLHDQRISAAARVLPAPQLLIRNITVPPKNNWAYDVSKARFDVEPSRVTMMNVIVFTHDKVTVPQAVYNRIRDFVNSSRTHYQFSQNPYKVIEFSDSAKHWGEVEKALSSKVPPNVFVLDFVKPRQSQDDAYPVVKRILGEAGYLSQFVNFKTCGHDDPKNSKKSGMILPGVARQILQKAGAQLWWVKLPREISLPRTVLYVGVDVFHAPRVLDPQTKKLGRKKSVAAIIVQLVTLTGAQRTYSTVHPREGGNEFGLASDLENTISNALKKFGEKPLCAVIWRDGMAVNSIRDDARKEVEGIRRGLASIQPVGTAGAKTKIPLAYIICQKRIGTKLLLKRGGTKVDGAPAGTLVSSIQEITGETFYINGRCPPGSTPKPVRFIVSELDKELRTLRLKELTWAMCHTYANWTGSIKVPAILQYAHKLAEFAGSLPDSGASLNSDAYLDRLYFL